ncbi:hypothetical protein I4F81_001914 [Pyropia yezoensis]|uniref:Uncharacterized protein n=1 Tax=Pyropia yezoensis TaxID=2788 RepID=A0ACC3BP90_PYRYE|nr:hypothetical protein I4F81_001914 [Neopyropia yezoensis]
MLLAHPLVGGSGGIPRHALSPPTLPIVAWAPSPLPAGRDGRRARLWLTVAVLCGSAVYLFASSSWAGRGRAGWTPVEGGGAPAAVFGPRGPAEGDTLVLDGQTVPPESSALTAGAPGPAGSTGGQGGRAADATTLGFSLREVGEGFLTAPAAVAVAPGAAAAAHAVAAPHVGNAWASAADEVVQRAVAGTASATDASRRSLHGGVGGGGGSSGGLVAAEPGGATSAVGHLVAAATAADVVHLGGTTRASPAVGGGRDGAAGVPSAAHLLESDAAADASSTGGAVPASTHGGGGYGAAAPSNSALVAATSRSETESVLPPMASMATVIGAIYVINAAPCIDKLSWVRERSRAAVGLDVPLTILPAVAGQDVSLDAPPLPVARMAMPADATVSGGQLAATASHRAAWRRAVAEGHPVVIVLEDDTFPTDELLARMPTLVRGLDAGAAAAETPWHVAYLSRHPLGPVAAEATWSVAGAEGDAASSVVAAAAGVRLPPPRRLTVAGRSWGGSAAYLLTATGARHLLDAVTTYTGPLDEALSGVAGLVVLSACDNDSPVHRCPENVVRAGALDMGGCAQPAAAVGEGRLARLFGEPQGEGADAASAATAAATAGAPHGAVTTGDVVDAVGRAGRDAGAARAGTTAGTTTAPGTPGGAAAMETLAQGDAASPVGRLDATERVVTTATPGAPARSATAGASDGAATTARGYDDAAASAAAAAAAAAAAPDDDDTAATLEGVAEGEAAALWGAVPGDATSPSGAALTATGAEGVAVPPAPPAAMRAHVGGARFYIN